MSDSDLSTQDLSTFSTSSSTDLSPFFSKYVLQTAGFDGKAFSESSRTSALTRPVIARFPQTNQSKHWYTQIHGDPEHT